MRSVIYKKRSGGELSREEIEFVVRGFVDGSIPDYQVSALLMAICLRGMTPQETGILTDAMLHSGDVMDLSGIPGPFVDKHSTGGVGDKISLILAPMVAACGLRVPMMSGRALGHTGGTLDKLESIPGYRTDLSQDQFRAGLLAEGFAMTGQTARIVPADKKLYALRDVTGTVESIPLITASILSKKVAEGADALIFDVKVGSGAFMKSRDEARQLATSLARTGHALGKRVVCLVTDMSTPLGKKVGNFFEVEESLDCLEGHGPADIMALSLRLGAWMLVAAGTVLNPEAGEARCADAIASGKARDLFIANVKRQGGDPAAMEALRGRCRSPYSFEIRAPEAGYIQAVDALAIGHCGIALGVGRQKTVDAVSPDVGFIFDKVKGESVSAGERILTVYGKDESSLEVVRSAVESAVTIGSTEPSSASLILEELALV